MQRGPRSRAPMLSELLGDLFGPPADASTMIAGEIENAHVLPVFRLLAER